MNATTPISWAHAYKDREDLAQFGSAGLALFAMALKFGYDDLETIGADAVVDGPDDRSCDVVYIDPDQRLAVVAQSYRADAPKQSANAGKAATLRQALSYLVEVDLASVPERIRPSASALRSALADGDIDQIYVWFVHNCPGSENVRSELGAVKQTTHSIIKSRFNAASVAVFAEEIASENLEKLYTDTNTPILVNDVVEFDARAGLEFDEGDWKCFVVPLRLRLLRSLYKQHNTRLFSANVRDFLGMKSGDSNINYQMQRSLQEKAVNFFVYNNGLTILTHRIDASRQGDGTMKVTVHGLSIVNGAQTTGTIGTAQEDPPEEAYVLARFISTASEDLVGEVVRYNNSQNAVTASDFRSTDPTQRRLVLEMAAIPEAEYDGGRRGGVSAAIKRRPKLLPSYSVGQAIAAVHGDPTVAYNEKSAIWSRDALYSRYFNDNLTASHIVFCYGLLKAVENEKNALRSKEKAGAALTNAEIDKLEFYRKRGAVFLLCGAVGECLETITNRVVANRFQLDFSQKISPEEAAKIWAPTVGALSGLHTHLEKAFSDGLKNQEKVRETLRAFSQLVASLRTPYASFFEDVERRLS
ncbi:MAG: AIPR family protein [Brevundimonas diminuta]|nr:AIPR family protein [Brevundimonas diminuta]MBD3817744.1 AIPR family protein [Brevundimonas diminuta]